MLNNIFFWIFHISLLVILIIVIRRYILIQISKKSKPHNLNGKYIETRINKLVHKNKNIEKLTYKELIELAERNLKDNNYKKSEQYFIYALSKSNKQNSPQVLKHLGNSYLQNEKYNKAIETYERLAMTSHLTAKEIFNLGLSFYKVGKLEKSKEKLLEAIKIEPNNFEYIKSLANILLINKEYKDLEKILLEELKISESVEILKELAYLYELTDNRKAELLIYEKIIKKNKNDKTILKKMKNLRINS